MHPIISSGTRTEWIAAPRREDFAVDVLKYYPRCAETGMRWIVVEAGKQIFPQVQRRLSRFIAELLRERGIGRVAYSPRGRGFLTGELRTEADGQALADDDFRKTSPRFTGENLRRNLLLAEEVRTVADEAGATPAQVALAWLLAKGDDIVPIPGTKRVTRLEENTAADGLTLTADQLATLDELTPPAGGHHTDAQMQMIER